MDRYKFKKGELDILDSHGTIITTESGEVYKYLPFVFKETEEEGVYEVYQMDEILDKQSETCDACGGEDIGCITSVCHSCGNKIHY